MIKSLKIALMSVFFALFAVACSGNGPEKAASAYMDAALANDVDKLMTTIDLSGLNDVEKTAAKGKLAFGLKYSQEKAESRGGFDKYTISDVQTQDNVATLKVKTAYKDGSVDVTDLSLVKVNDQWFVALK